MSNSGITSYHVHCIITCFIAVVCKHVLQQRCKKNLKKNLEATEK